MNVSHRFVIIAAVFVTRLITANIIAVKPISLGVSLLGQPVSVRGGQEAYRSILGYTPQILSASLLAYLVGEFSNSFTYTVVNCLKKKEAIDTYDYETNFNPFLVSN